LRGTSNDGRNCSKRKRYEKERRRKGGGKDAYTTAKEATTTRRTAPSPLISFDDTALLLLPLLPPLNPPLLPLSDEEDPLVAVEVVVDVEGEDEARVTIVVAAELLARPLKQS
jgi:hypothetical protein